MISRARVGNVVIYTTESKRESLSIKHMPLRYQLPGCSVTEVETDNLFRNADRGENPCYDLTSALYKLVVEPFFPGEEVGKLTRKRSAVLYFTPATLNHIG